MKVRNLVFDIGGVIINDSDGALEKFLRLSSDEMNEVNRVIYSDVRWKDKVMLGYMSQEEYARELVSELPEWKTVIEKCLLPKYQPEVVPILYDNLKYITDLKRSNKYNLYVLSNLTSATYSYLKECLQMFNGGVYSFQAHIRKPDPRIYQVLFTKYNLKPAECLFFDDRKKNIETGETLGMKGIVVKSLDDIKSAGLL